MRCASLKKKLGRDKMSDTNQLDLFGQQEAKQDPKGPGDSGKTCEPSPPPGPAADGVSSFVAPVGHGEAQPYPIPCARCRRIFDFSWDWGKVVCQGCDGGLPAEPVTPSSAPDIDERCMVIGCVQIPDRREGEFEVCKQHHTDRLREILATGSWPGQFDFAGSTMLLPTRRRLDGTREPGAGLYKEKPHGDSP